MNEKLDEPTWEDAAFHLRKMVLEHSGNDSYDEITVPQHQQCLKILHPPPPHSLSDVRKRARLQGLARSLHAFVCLTTSSLPFSAEWAELLCAEHAVAKQHFIICLTQKTHFREAPPHPSVCLRHKTTAPTEVNAPISFGFKYNLKYYRLQLLFL